MRHPFLRDILSVVSFVACVVIGTILLNAFVFRSYNVVGISMENTLHDDDRVIVNRLAVTWAHFLGQEYVPQRGDIVVFKYPLDKNIDFIKRVIGVPGDEIRYINKQLYVNGKRIEATPDGNFFDKETYTDLKQFNENLEGVVHKIVENDKVPSMARPVQGHNGLNQCIYNMGDVVCRVPDGHYFMMGDNRDNSADSRFWGFVPKEDIVGRAFYIWLNISDMGRIGSIQ